MTLSVYQNLVHFEQTYLWRTQLIDTYHKTLFPEMYYTAIFCTS